jgi:hypothetical protein
MRYGKPYVGQPRVCAAFDTSSLRSAHGDKHCRWIAGVEATRDVGIVNVRHETRIVCHFPATKALWPAPELLSAYRLGDHG